MTVKTLLAPRHFLAAALLGSAAACAPTARTPINTPEVGQTAVQRAAVSAELIGQRTARYEVLARDTSVSLLPATQIEPYLDLQQDRLQTAAQGSGARVERAPGVLRITIPGADAFATGSAVIGPDMRRALDSLAPVLATYAQSFVDVYGHSDASGDALFNMTLSQRRAESVANYLVAKGVSRARIASLGRGEEDPIATNDTEAGRAENRRVEIRVIPAVNGTSS